jgi:hypothetical protein
LRLALTGRIEAILFGLFLFNKLPADRATNSVMKFEKGAVDEMLSGGKENLELFVGDDAGIEEFILRKDITWIVVLDTPGIEGIRNSISPTTDTRRAWCGRGGRKRRRHGEEMEVEVGVGVNETRVVLSMGIEIAKHVWSSRKC